MKTILNHFKRSKEAKYFGSTIGIVWMVLIILALISMRKTHRTADSILSMENREKAHPMDWQDPELRSALKKNIWLQNQISLAKDPSLSLGIDLNDSVIQIQINGLALLQSRILYIQPKEFLTDIDAGVYAKLFGKTAIIIEEKSQTLKRPIRKKKVIRGADIVEEKLDSISQHFQWEFVMDHHIKVVVNGLSPVNDTVLEAPDIEMDRFRYHLASALQKQDSLAYHPVLFLWLNEKEARAIYRALPDHAKVLLRN